MRNLNKIAVLFALISVIFSSLTIASASVSSASPSKSPSAETELICHTDNPAECYPKLFSATEEFQIVRDDQDLPPGLHVRLDIQTGQKQAKLNNPKEGNSALEGLPVDRSVVVVDPETPQDDQPPIRSGAPAYEPVGVVKAPREKNEGFVQALETVKKDLDFGPSDELDRALQDLEDISHDMYYGLQIAEDTEALQALFCLLTKRDASAAVEERPLTERPDFLASSILASLIRNNKPALRAVEDSWDAVVSKQCKNPRDAGSLGTELYARLEPTAGPGTAEEAAEAYFARLSLAVWDGLLKSSKIQAEFLANGGMRSFLRILLRSGEAWDGRRAKVARIVSDVFLDEEVGAVLGVWPATTAESSSVVSDASVCEKSGAAADDDRGCWEYHLEAISRDPRDAIWSRPLLDMLRRRRPDATKSAPRQPKRDEL